MSGKVSHTLVDAAVNLMEDGKTPQEAIDLLLSEAKTDKEMLSKGFDAGNYANAYTSEDYHTALKKLQSANKVIDHPAWWAGLVIGFFATYEANEIPPKYKGMWQAAMRNWGKKAKAAGYID